MKKKKKIFIINDHYKPKGGADRMAQEMYHKFLSEGYSVDFFSYLDVEHNYYNNSYKNLFKNFLNFRVYLEIRKKLISFNPDTIFIHSWTKQLTSSCFLACRGRNVNLISHDYFLSCPNGGKYNYQKDIICNLSGGSAKCALCHCDKQNYIVKLYRFLRFVVQKIIIKKIRPTVFCLNEIQESLLINDGLEIILKKNNIDYIQQSSLFVVDKCYFVGRSDPEKGLQSIINLAKECEYYFKLIGIEKNEVCNDISNIDCLGWMNAEDIFFELQSARLLLFTSIWFEADPLVPLEACALGIPIVCSKENVFANTLREYDLEDFIFKNQKDLNNRFSELYDLAKNIEIRKNFLDIFKNEKMKRQKLDFLL